MVAGLGAAENQLRCLVLMVVGEEGDGVPNVRVVAADANDFATIGRYAAGGHLFIRPGRCPAS